MKGYCPIGLHAINYAGPYHKSLGAGGIRQTAKAPADDTSEGALQFKVTEVLMDLKGMLDYKHPE
jgi:hypothetical protein